MPGTYEAPLVVRNLLKRDDIDSVVIVGYIEKVGAHLHTPMETTLGGPPRRCPSGFFIGSGSMSISPGCSNSWRVRQG